MPVSSSISEPSYLLNKASSADQGVSWSAWVKGNSIYQYDRHTAVGTILLQK